MYKKILFGTCLTEYCGHIFSYALNLAIEHNAKLWIYHGLGRQSVDEERRSDMIKEAQGRVAEAYVEEMKRRGFSDYAINVSAGDVVSELSRLAKDAQIDLLVMGTSTDTPTAMGESVGVGTLGPTVTETILRSPCPVVIVPPALVPGLAR